MNFLIFHALNLPTSSLLRGFIEKVRDWSRREKKEEMGVDLRQVVAAVLTLTMFVMLGNMIKRDHFDSLQVTPFSLHIFLSLPHYLFISISIFTLHTHHNIHTTLLFFCLISYLEIPCLHSQTWAWREVLNCFIDHFQLNTHRNALYFNHFFFTAHPFSSISPRKRVLYNDCQTIVNYLAHISVSEFPVGYECQFLLSDN